MRKFLKITGWLVGILLLLLLLLVLLYPMIAAMLVKPKYERLSQHGEGMPGYQAEVEGAQPRVACGGTAGQYNWGEATRRYVSLNGQWQLAEGSLDENSPQHWSHTAPVPGLLVSARPALTELGEPSEQREAFWYRRSFTAPTEAQATALLCIAKAKYGVKTWLNGVLLGQHYGAFTQAEFDLAGAIRWGEENELIVRLGAERSSLPDFIPAGQDQEKEYWLPGIWDDVNLLFTGPQTVVRVKVETDIEQGIAHIGSWISNNSDEPVVLELQQNLREWRSGTPVSEPMSLELTLAAGETRRVSQSIAVADRRLWTLEDPFLYLAESRLLQYGEPVDDRVVRFGFRHVEWRGGDRKGFYLNGEKVFLRGSNFSLHRFFEDPLVDTLPWQEAWVRKLFTSYPVQYQWNVFRASIGRLPNFWYHIADETGFLIDDEFAWWTLLPEDMLGGGGLRDASHRNWSIVELEKEFTSWLQENWNHPSIAWWSASNETTDTRSREVIERVRHLDPTRQWENGGWQAPHREGDPIEDHPYVFSANFNPLMALLGQQAGSIEVLDEKDGAAPRPDRLLAMTYPAWDHPYVINEYGWLWLDRKGNPTQLTDKVYAKLVGEAATAGERREAYAYLHGGLTGFWRSRRGVEGVQHFSYLNHSKPGTNFTSDNFIDLPNLLMEPRWHEYHRNVWLPVAVYIDSWRQDYRRGKTGSVPLTLINDHNREFAARLDLMAVSTTGQVLSQAVSQDLLLEPLERVELETELAIPDREQFVLYSRLVPADGSQPTMWDRRKVGLAHPGVVVADPPFEIAE